MFKRKNRGLGQFLNYNRVENWNPWIVEYQSFAYRAYIQSRTQYGIKTINDNMYEVIDSHYRFLRKYALSRVAKAKTRDDKRRCRVGLIGLRKFRDEMYSFIDKVKEMKNEI